MNMDVIPYGDEIDDSFDMEPKKDTKDNEKFEYLGMSKSTADPSIITSVSYA